MEELKVGVVIVAAGSGKRMGTALPKQFAMVANQPILAHTINTFAKTLPTAKIVVVLAKEYIEFWKNLSKRFDIAAHTVVEGGKERFHSVRLGIHALPGGLDLVAIQDGVRPLASEQLIKRGIECASEHGAAIPVTPAIDSFRRMTSECDSEIIDRAVLRIVQTPQIFDASILLSAYDTPFDDAFTDDASVVERYGHKVALYEGEPTNIKITTPNDMLVAEVYLRQANNADDE